MGKLAEGLTLQTREVQTDEAVGEMDRRRQNRGCCKTAGDYRQSRTPVLETAFSQMGGSGGGGQKSRNRKDSHCLHRGGGGQKGHQTGRKGSHV